MKAKKMTVGVVALASLCMMASMGKSVSSEIFTATAMKLAGKTYNGKFYSDYTSLDEVIAAGEELNEEINAEGMTLLKNKDNVLPLDGAKNITVLGKNSINPQYAGAGSGAGGGACVDLYTSLKDAGFKTNPVVKAFYENNARSGSGAVTATFFGPSVEIQIGETAQASYDDSVKSSFEAYNDAAVVFFKRSGSEGADNPRTVGDFSTDSAEVKLSHHYFELSENEKALLEMAKANFGKVIVVLNTPSPLEVKMLRDDDQIQGVIWAGLPGGTGFKSLGKILNGSVNPSGKTVDTWAADYRKDPTWNNFGDGSQTSADMKTTNYTLTNPDGKNISGRYDETGEDVQGDDVKGTGLSTVDTFVRYEEGIYTGYRYYETVGHDKNDSDVWYKDNVVYPFGFGLSYTSFEYTLPSAKTLTITKDGKFSAKIHVKNTGERAGKTVLQAYFKAPYIDGEIEKAYERLATYAKTPMLQPGEETDVTLEFFYQDMASYDSDDVNHNTHKGYELDAGHYEVSINTSAHDVEGTFSGELDADINYDIDRATGGKVENAFQGANASLPSKEGMFTPMSRKAGADYMKLPDAPTAEECKVDDKMLKKLTNVFTADDLENDKSWYKSIYGEDDPRKISDELKAKFTSGEWKQQPETGDRDALYKSFQEIAQLDFDDDTEWNKVLNNLKYSEMLTLMQQGGWSTAACDFLGKAKATDKDGPSGLGSVSYAVEVNIAATFNDDLTEKFGDLCGEESLWKDIPGWYAPAADAHRSVFGGRNFEYYSEDPVLAGRSAARTIVGAQAKGAHVYLKHYALNDQEASRSGISTFVSEQAVREVYLKPFEIGVKEGNPTGMMGGMNRIGVVENYGNYGLMTQTLRNEWGFKGCMDTDAGTSSDVKGTRSPILMYTSGTNLNLGTFSNNAAYGVYDATANTVTVNNTAVYSFWYHVRQNAKAVLFETSHSSESDNGLKLSAIQDKNVEVKTGIAFSNDIAINPVDLGTTSISYEAASELPAGVTLSNTGVLAGKIENDGTYTITVNVYVDGWIKKTMEITLTSVNPIKVSGSLTAGVAASGVKLSNDAYKVGDLYGVTSRRTTTYYELTKIGYSAKGLPEGLTLDDEGNITGTATTAGTYTVAVTIKGTYNVNGQDKTANLITINLLLTVAAGAETPVDPSEPSNPSADASEKADAAAEKADAAAEKADAAAAAAAAAQAAADAAQAAADAAAAKADSKSGGCGGSVAIASSLVGAAGLAGLGLYLKKRKEDK